MRMTIGWAALSVLLLPGCLDNSARIERQRRDADREARAMQTEDDLHRLQDGLSALERGLAQERAERERLHREVDALRAASQAAAAKPAPAAAPAPERAARPALSAEETSVLRIQEALKRAGYDPGPSDGKMGQKTKSALMAFQKDNGLKADGVLGPQTLAKLQKHLADDP